MGNFSGTWQRSKRAVAKEEYINQQVWQFGGVRPFYPTGKDRAISIAFQSMLTVAVILGMYVFWDVKWTNVQADAIQSDVAQSLDQSWQEQGEGAQDVDPAVVDEGTALAHMYIPAFNSGDTVWDYVVVNGTSGDSLMAGPGYYTGSQRFGERGNAGIAGHRDGRGAPFHDLDKLATCDTIAIETATQWHIYKVLPTGEDYVEGEELSGAMTDCVPYEVSSQLTTPMYFNLAGREITTPEDVDVLAPVPNKPAVAPGNAGLSMLTLTTCHPIWSNAQRMIIHAVLAESIDKKDHAQDFVPADVAA